MNNKKEVLVIIPAYNEEQSIGALLRQFETEQLNTIVDVLVINDHSRDKTESIARDMGAIVVNNVFNLGYGSSLQIGYKYATENDYRYVIQIDADGQHAISNVRTIYTALTQPQNGVRPDIVLGSRFAPGSETFPVEGVKLFAIKLFRRLIHMITGKTVLDPTSGLQGLNRRAFTYYSGFNQFNSRYPDANMIIQMLLRGYTVREIPSVMYARETGTSMHSGWLNAAGYMLVMMASILNVTLREKREARKNSTKNISASAL